MRIINGLIYRPDGEFKSGTLEINGDVISGVSDFVCSLNNNEEVIDAQGMFIIPGLTDIHFHGCMGFDLCDGDVNALRAIASYQARNGITSICPATMTLAPERIIKILKAAREFRDLNFSECAELVGINLEGPFISPAKCGAQDPKFAIKPDIDLFAEFYEASGKLIKICCVAPELDGAIDFIKHLHENFSDVRVSLAHTCADYDTALQAFNAGLNHITHLYNAMNPITHRSPGPILAAADFNDFNQAVMAELICDGVHVHAAAIRNAFRLFNDNIIMISDSLRATGMPDGEYELGGQIFIKQGHKACLKTSPETLAGSVTNLMDCVRFAVKNNIINLEQAVKCAAVNPAMAINIYDKFGSIEPGKTANLVILNKNLETAKVFIRGKIL